MRIGVLGISILLFFLLACSKKMGEKEYYDLASQYMTKEDWKQAENYFEKIVQEYPNGIYTSKAIFMIGFINANYLKDYDKARKYYQMFLKKYPKHELADDAKYELEHMGQDFENLPFLKGGGSKGSTGEKAQTETQSKTQ